jgi:hypothetical protein
VGRYWVPRYLVQVPRYLLVPGTAATLAYLPTPMINEDDFWSNWWNKNWQGKSKYSEKTYPSVTLSTTKSHMTDPVSNPGPQRGKPATNRLSYGAALSEILTKISPRKWALLEKPPVVQLLKNFRTFYGTRRFIAVFTRALHWSLFWTRLIQSIPTYHISQRFVLIHVLFIHLLLGLPSGLSPSAFSNFLYAFLFSPFVLPTLSISSSLTWSF